MSNKFTDGLKDVFSGLINKRNGVNRNVVTARRLDDSELRTMYKTGLMSKIIRLKAGYSLNDTIKFESKEDEEFYNKRLAKHVKRAAKYMLGFGRGVIILFNNDNTDLTTPLKPSDYNSETLQLRVFSGDDVTAISPIYDLRSPRYYKPSTYIVNGQSVHWTRVIDLTYYEPPERDKPDYNYGGLSESELIYDQFVADGVVQRAASTIIDKASTFVYKIKGYKDKLAMKQDKDIVQYVSTCEDGRSIYGALVTDAEDMVDVLNQSLADLDKVDNITLRRLAMVTGLGMTVLIGEQTSGLNSSGESERQGFQDTIENMQSDYLLEPLNLLAKIFGLGEVSFKENQGQSAVELIDYETKAVANAKTLWEMGEDHSAYLKDKDVIKKDDWESFWSDNKFKDEKMEAGKNGYISVSIVKEDAEAIKKWLDESGVESFINPNDLHATLFYAREGMDVIGLNPEKVFNAKVSGNLELMGDPSSEWYAIAMKFNKGELDVRHQEIKGSTMSKHSYPDFAAHMSFKYKPTDGDVDKLKATPFPLEAVRFTNESQEDIQ